MKANRPSLMVVLTKGAALGAITACLWRASRKALDYARATRSLSRGLSTSLDEPWQWMPG